jgi:hypothetical protein
MESKLSNALQAYRQGEYKTIRACAAAYHVNHVTLTRRVNDGLSRKEAHVT